MITILLDRGSVCMGDDVEDNRIISMDVSDTMIFEVIQFCNKK